MKKKLQGLSLLYRYIITFSSLILLCCTVIGLFAVGSGIVKLKRQSTEYRKNLLSILAADLDRQYDLMQEYALKISVDYHFNPAFADNRAIYEIELIELMGKYGNVTPLAENIFLMFGDNASVFLPGGKSRLSSFATHRLGVEDSGALYEQLLSCAASGAVIPKDSTNGSMLFVFPIVFQSHRGRMNAYVCYTSSSTTLLRRIADVTGERDGGWELSCPSGVLASNGTPGNQERLSTVTASGLRITLDDVSGSALKYFGNVNLIILVLFSGAFLMLAVLFAYKTYEPLRKLIAKLDKSRQADGENEFCRISRHIDELQTQKEDVAHKLDSQQRLLDHQRLLLMLREDGFSGTRESPEFFRSGGKYHIVCSVRTAPPELAQNLCPVIEELSDDSMPFLAVYTPWQSCIAVLVSSYESSDLADAPSMLSELLEASEISFSSGASPVFEEASRLPFAFYHALTAHDATDESRKPPVSREPSWYDGDALEHLCAAVQKGDRDEAEKHLDIFFDQTQRLSCDRPSMQLLYNSLFARLHGLYSSLRLPDDTSHLSVLRGVTDQGALRADALYHIEQLCQSRESRTMLSDILLYIDRHFTEYNFDQNTTAEHFDISVSRLYRIIKTGTGNNFTHYLTSTRISRAKELLENGASVTEASSSIGYSSVSFFIRTFKKITGYTPASYRALKNTEKREPAILKENLQ